MSAGGFLFIFLNVYIRTWSLATLIDPQNPDTRSSTYIHCLSSSNDVVQIKNLFDPTMAQNQNFMGMEWYRYENGSETLLFRRGPPNILDALLQPKFTQFEFWGLQINDANVYDSATYTAKLTLLSAIHEWTSQILIAAPPQLTSTKLSVHRHDRNISCGQFASLGVPPIEVRFKAHNGSVLPSVFRKGFMELELTEIETDKEKISCEVNDMSPAFHCVSAGDQWQYKENFSNSVEREIMAGVTAAVVVLIIIIIVVMIKWRKSRKTYSRDQGQKSIHAFSPNTNRLLLGKYSSFAQESIYKGPTESLHKVYTPSPYRPSSISMSSMDHI